METAGSATGSEGVGEGIGEGIGKHEDGTLPLDLSHAEVLTLFKHVLNLDEVTYTQVLPTMQHHLLELHINRMNAAAKKLGVTPQLKTGDIIQTVRLGCLNYGPNTLPLGPDG